jgi:hypothetical protein
LSKILIFDIETRPTKAWVWRGYKENIGPGQIEEPGGLLCFSAKWLGKKDIMFFSEWEHGYLGMLEAASDLLEQADVLVTYNGERFDYPHFVTEFILAGVSPPPPPSHVDLYKFFRNKTRFFSNKLEHIASMLHIGHKMEHEGFGLWKKVMAGDEQAQAKMKKYCVHDCRLTEGVYKRVRPYITNHPNVGSGHSCPKCNSARVHRRGFRLTAHYRVERLQCQKCGGWTTGKRTKIS